MKRFKSLVITLALFTLSSTAFAAEPAARTTDNANAHAVGIVTPDVASTVVVFDNYSRFPKTGEFALCADGQDSSECKSKQYLTPEQLVAKFYPQATYVGFRLIVSGSSNGDDTYLHLYLKKKPQ
jgi:hypothetical protein